MKKIILILTLVIFVKSLPTSYDLIKKRGQGRQVSSCSGGADIIKYFDTIAVYIKSFCITDDDGDFATAASLCANNDMKLFQVTSDDDFNGVVEFLDANLDAEDEVHFHIGGNFQENGSWVVGNSLLPAAYNPSSTALRGPCLEFNRGFFGSYLTGEPCTTVWYSLCEYYSMPTDFLVYPTTTVESITESNAVTTNSLSTIEITTSSHNQSTESQSTVSFPPTDSTFLATTPTITSSSVIFSTSTSSKPTTATDLPSSQEPSRSTTQNAPQTTAQTAISTSQLIPTSTQTSPPTTTSSPSVVPQTSSTSFIVTTAVPATTTMPTVTLLPLPSPGNSAIDKVIGSIGSTITNIFSKFVLINESKDRVQEVLVKVDEKVKILNAVFGKIFKFFSLRG
jgi:hypothetical protein